MYKEYHCFPELAKKCLEEMDLEGKKKSKSKPRQCGTMFCLDWEVQEPGGMWIARV